MSTNGGNSAGASAVLNAGTNGLAVDSQGNILAALAGASKVLVYNSSGALRGQLNPGVLGALSQPNGIAVDSKDNIFVSDTGNHRVVWFSSYATGARPTGQVLNGQLNSALTQPTGLALDAQDNLLVTDTQNNRIVVFTVGHVSTGAVATVVASGQIGPTVGTLGQLNNPLGVAVDSAGNIAVADTGNNRVALFNSVAANKTPRGAIGPQVGFLGQLITPTGVAVNLKDPNAAAKDEVLVVDSGNARIAMFNPIAAGATPHGSITSNTNTGPLTAITGGIATNAAGNILLLDPGNGHLLEFSDAGKLLFVTSVTF